VLGVSPLNPFLLAGWKRGDRRGQVSLQHLVDHIDHICQLAGDARHVGLGSDFDGGFGVQSVPLEIDTIADLQKLVPLLGERGYSQEDTASILGGNWLELLQDTLPES
jgi:membrane dipeptidase